MKKAIVFFVMLIAGLIVTEQAVDILTTRGRGEAIYKMGMLIPAQDFYLYLYGSIFLLIGVLLIFSPLLFRKFFMTREKRVSTNSKVKWNLKRAVVFFIMLIAGLIVTEQAIDILTTRGRGEAIYKMGMLIPAQDFYLYLYGSIFLLLGILLILSPLLFKKSFIEKKSV
ncbi:hypothetical protein [Paenibacillus sp. CH40]|uniref:hypothetical protein n=1 Tax=Paenibacillus sp. CH40 TaxID=2962045 RepID=UPI0020B794F1|nr:hypothetical protein [Paenibacillus sp. CH40]MCP3796422.1 hypothetical protein [Paenibacillus sp. CH40]